MLVFRPFLRLLRSAQGRNRTADTGIFNRLQLSEKQQRNSHKNAGRGLYVGDLGNLGTPLSEEDMGDMWRRTVSG
jgi:hypothetical protein